MIRTRATMCRRSTRFRRRHRLRATEAGAAGYTYPHAFRLPSALVPGLWITGPSQPTVTPTPAVTPAPPTEFELASELAPVPLDGHDRGWRVLKGGLRGSDRCWAYQP